MDMARHCQLNDWEYLNPHHLCGLALEEEMKYIFNSVPSSPRAKVAKGALFFIFAGGSELATEEIGVKCLMEKLIVDSLLEPSGKGPEDAWPNFLPVNIFLTQSEPLTMGLRLLVTTG